MNSTLSALPNGLVQSKPPLAPVRLPCSEHRRDVDEVDRSVVDDAFALLHQLLDEMAQAEPVAVDLGHDLPFNPG